MSRVPNTWLTCTLGDVVNYGTTEKAEPDEIPDDAWLLELEDIEKDTSKILHRLTFRQRQSKSTKNRFGTGDILYGKLRPYLNKVVRADQDGYCTTEIVPIKATGVVVGAYLFHWLKNPTFIDYVTSVSHGLNMPRLGTEAGKKAPFILAPLPEQKRIAEKLDVLLARVDACRDRLDLIPVILKRFRQSVLAAAYTGQLTEGFRATASLTPVEESILAVDIPPRPNRFSSRTDRVIDGDYALAVGKPDRAIPYRWRWTSLVDIARMESGHTPSRAHPEYWNGGDIPWIGIADARDGHGKTIYDTYQHTNSLGLANSAARLIPAGTVCLSRTASVGYVVRMGVDMATSQDFANWTCTEAINPDWLKFLFVAETEAIYRFGKGSTHTTVYYPELMALHVALPCIEEQAEIVRRIEALFGYADRLEARYVAAHSQVERLTPALLTMAFRGELVPQDPKDEPASSLLARIAKVRQQKSKKKSVVKGME